MRLSEIFLQLLSSGQKPALRIVLRAGLWTEVLFEGFFVQENFFFFDFSDQPSRFRKQFRGIQMVT